MSPRSIDTRRFHSFIRWGLGFVFLAAGLPFATVHPSIIAVVGLLCGLAGVVAAFVGLRERAPTRAALILGVVAASGLVWSLITFIPVGPSGRSLLQPGMAEILNLALEVGGSPLHPLALRPNEALSSWSFAAFTFVLAVGAAGLVARFRHAERISIALVGSGSALALVGWLHQWTHATSIWWFSSVPTYATGPFFAPFVNPNHAGIAFAALTPLALAIALASSGTTRHLAAAGSALLAVGTLVCGSRGTPIILLASLAILGGILGRHALRRAILWAGLGLVAMLVIAGSIPTLQAYSAWVAPEEITPHNVDDPFAGRLGIYQDSWRIFEKAPIVGVGSAGFLDGFRAFSTLQSRRLVTHAHNDYIQMAVEHGVPALVSALTTLALLAWLGLRSLGQDSTAGRFLRAGLVSGIGALCLGALYDFPLHIGALNVLFALMAGTLVGLSERRRRPAATPWRRRLLVATCAMGGSAVLASATALLVQHRTDSAWGSSDHTARMATNLFKQSESTETGWEQVLEMHRQAIRQRPLDPVLHLRLARATWTSGDVEQAMDQVRVLCRIDDGLSESWGLLARYYESKGMEREAIRAWQSAFSLPFPSREVLYGWLGQALIGHKDPSRLALVLLPDQPVLQHAAAEVMESANRGNEAEPLFRRAAALDPRYRRYLASYLLRVNRVEDALAEARTCPEACVCQRVIIRTLARLSRDQEILDASSQALSLCGSDDVAIRIDVARARLNLGDTRGLSILNQILVDQPDAHEARRALLPWYRSLGKTTEMRQNLEYLLDAEVAQHREIEELLDLLATEAQIRDPAGR